MISYLIHKANRQNESVRSTWQVNCDYNSLFRLKKKNISSSLEGFKSVCEKYVFPLLEAVLICKLQKASVKIICEEII